MSGFSIAGVHSSELKLKVLDISRPLLPEINDHRESIPGRDGTILFPLNFGDKEIEIECVLMHDTVESRNTDLRSLARKLFSFNETRIEFDDEPDVYYIGKVSENIEVDQYADYGKLSLTFACQSFAYAKEETVVEGTFSTQDEIFTFINDASIDSEFTLEVTMKSSAEILNITLNNQTLSLIDNLSQGDKFVVKSEYFETVKIVNNVQTNVSDRMQGIFPIVDIGENKLNISFKHTGSCSFILRYRKRYL